MLLYFFLFFHCFVAKGGKQQKEDISTNEHCSAPVCRLKYTTLTEQLKYLCNDICQVEKLAEEELEGVEAVSATVQTPVP